MNDSEFDRALIAAAFDIAAERGWNRMTVAQAARRAGLELGRARGRFPHRGVVLLRFGREADGAALAAAVPGSPVRDQLFDMLMRRIDAMQTHRAGILALFHALPTNPPMAMLLASANLCSMAWLLDAAEISTTGPLGKLRVKGLMAVWLWTVRAWCADKSVDLAATMAALDHALRRAETAECWLRPSRRSTGPTSTPQAPHADEASPHEERPDMTAPHDPPAEASPFLNTPPDVTPPDVTPLA
jgi:ubiquinone biosynthesis protein COQ9